METNFGLRAIIITEKMAPRSNFQMDIKLGI